MKAGHSGGRAVRTAATPQGEVSSGEGADAVDTGRRGPGAWGPVVVSDRLWTHRRTLRIDELPADRSTSLRAMLAASQLELDLDVFAGPFDLLLTLVLREEVDLLEVDLADVVLAYLDHLEAKGELDLEAATEFLV